MVISVDFHSHIYPCYSLTASLKAALEHQDQEYKIAFLTERSDCKYFNQIPSLLCENLDLRLSKQGTNYIEINNKLLIFQGRQFASKEGVEVLSLFCSPSMEDMLPATEYCDAVVNQGGLVAFSWAFGKWTGKRGELINQLCQKLGKDKVVLLDSRLRPKLLALPLQIVEMHSAGYKLFAGSDPLPLASHADKIMSFGMNFSGEFNSDYPELSLKDLIFNAPYSSSFGTQSTLLEFVKDQLMLRV